MNHDRLLGQTHSDRGQRFREQVRLVDDREIRDMATLALLDEGYQVVSASHAAEGLQRVQQYPPDPILLDVQMPVIGAATYAERCHALHEPHAPIVLFTAEGSARRCAERVGAATCDNEPADARSLADLIRCRVAGAGPASAAVH